MATRRMGRAERRASEVGSDGARERVRARAASPGGQEHQDGRTARREEIVPKMEGKLQAMSWGRRL